MTFIAFFFCYICSILSSDWSGSLFITLGGSGSDTAYSVQQTFDGVYVLTGSTRSFGESSDVLLAKFYSNRTLEWACVFGGTYSGTEDGHSVQQTFDGGFIVTGKTEISYNQHDIFLAKFHSNGSLEWSTEFGGSGYDVGESVQQTFEGGYIVAGHTNSFGAGISDVLLVKFFSNGSLEWATTLGGTNDDSGHSVQQTFDGGYIVTGSTNSNDVLLAKIYSNGSLDWASKHGGGSKGMSIQQTVDDGYIVSGRTEYLGDGDVDIFLSKFTSVGNLEWASTLTITPGGDEYNTGYSVSETIDGSYIVACRIVEESWSSTNVLLAKFNSDGSLDWASILGGNFYDDVYSVSETFDGDYIVTGSTESFGEMGYSDIFLARVDKNGNALLRQECPAAWVKIYPQFVILDAESAFFDNSFTLIVEYETSMNFQYTISPFFEFVTDDITVGMQECSIYRGCFGVYDGLYDSDTCSRNGDCSENETCDCFQNYFGLACNISQCNGILSNDTEVCSGHGVCVDFDECSNCTEDFFGEFCELRQYPSFLSLFDFNSQEGRSSQLTSDGGFIVSGSIFIPAGSWDLFLAKFHSNGALDWSLRLLGGDGEDSGDSVQQTFDGGYIVTGKAKGPGTEFDVLLAKFYSNGSLEWSVTLGGSYDDVSLSVIQTLDGDYVLTGYTGSFGAGNIDLLLAKFYSNGTLDWVKTLGESDSETYGHSIQQTFDGGYIVTGISEQSLLLAKFFPDGSLEWAVTLVGDFYEVGNSIQQTFDGGYVVTGETRSYGAGAVDILVAKFSSDGSLEWSIATGGSEDDKGNSIEQTSDGGFIVSGYSLSYDLSSSFLLLKLNPDGSLDWVSIFVGTYPDRADNGNSVHQTPDGGYVITGYTNSLDESDMRMILFTKVYSDGEGCEYFDRITNDISFEYSTDDIVASPIESLSLEDHSSSFTIGFVALDFEFFNDTEYFHSVCSIEFSCFGTAVLSKMCSGHGDCTGHNVCTCNNDYFGIECEVQRCFEIFSNDTQIVCSGHGVCIDHNDCKCDTNYTALGDCSLWKCFGKWENDLTVCSGVIGRGNVSHGNCTSNDFCVCEKGYQRSISCDWECQGDPHWEEEACGPNGNCIDYDVCNCTTTDYVGVICDIQTCAFISSLDTDVVCSGHGECISPDVCDCELGYSMAEPGLCDWWTCFGIQWDDKSAVCSEGKGDCIGYNLCDCKDSNEGEECETWSCGLADKSDPKTCSGNGKCDDPDDCVCNFGFKGDLCETNTLYATVMAPVLSVGGILGLLIFFIIVFCCCVCFCCVYCCAVCLVCGLLTILFGQTFRWRKFSKLKNIDILLQEQEADENTNVANIRINKKLFEIPHKEIRLIRILGSGGSSSTVFLANWKNQKVAYKCFKTQYICTSQATFDEFEKEAEVFASISHPSIVGFFGCTMDPPRVGIVMEFCEKGECLDYIRKYKLVKGVKYPNKERFRMLYEICTAMDYLHSRKIVHRDLKCENVLLNRSEQCKIMDFGLSKISDRLSKQVTKGIGTPFYMAPEITTGGFEGEKRGYDEKCDVFSFSIVVFLLITGLSQPYSKEDVKGHSIEMMVANNPNFRPNTEIMKEALKKKKKGNNLRWIIEETEKCWDHVPENRPSFDELCQIFIKKMNFGMMGEQQVDDDDDSSSQSTSTTSSDDNSKNDSDDYVESKEEEEVEVKSDDTSEEEETESSFEDVKKRLKLSQEKVRMLIKENKDLKKQVRILQKKK